MIRRLTVPTANPYDVHIGGGVSSRLGEVLGADVLRVAIIHPAELAHRAAGLRADLAGGGREVHLVEVPDGDAAKTADVLQFCWDVLGQAGFTRSDAVVGFGGGATTDLAGFVAASWLRGVRFVNVPTTVLGMVDAAVGGKTGINTAAGKNLVGAFYEPAGVLCDLDLLATLPPAELRSGLAEVVKCGFIADPSILGLVEASPADALDPTSSVVAELISRGITVKARTVGGDLYETGAGGGIGREALNYGHTFGHAIEKNEHYRFRHGEAVAIGMVFVAELALRTGSIDQALVDRHRSVLTMLGLPTTYRADAWEPLLAAMRIDKKSRGDQLRFVVLEDLAHPTILAGPPEDALLDSYRSVSAP